MTPYALGRNSALVQLGFAKTAGPLGMALSESADDFVDTTTGDYADPHKVVLKQLGIMDFPEIIPIQEFEAQQETEANPMPTTDVNPPAPIKTSGFKFGGGGPMMDPTIQEAPEYHLPPQRHRLLGGDPGFRAPDRSTEQSTADTETKAEPIPGDNERSGGGDGGGSAAVSRGGAEVTVPDQTPQRQAMSLYDTPSSDVGGIFNNFDQRLQNPASNSIVRFVGE